MIWVLFSGLPRTLPASKCCKNYDLIAIAILRKQGSTPPPLGRRVCETKVCEKGRARDGKPCIHRVYSAQRGVGTMVSDRGLGRGQTMG